jgi:hypothetical protein
MIKFQYLGIASLIVNNHWVKLNQVWKEIGRDKSTSLFPELTLEKLVFLHHKYYSIYLLQWEASALQSK